jgi:succinoglycan biosynthesis protein ExoA
MEGRLWQPSGLNKKAYHTVKEMADVKVSVVIPTLNSAQTLEKCLTSIGANNSKYKYEVITVDAGSNDETLQIAEKYADKIVIGVANRINRNAGIRNAEGEIICFTDSDCVVPADWIDSLVDGLLRLNRKDNRIIGVGGWNIPFLEDISQVELTISEAMRSPLISCGARNTAVYESEREVSHNPPLNSACFKWVIEEMGGFVEEPGYPEDLDIDARITENGYRLYYLPQLAVFHKHKSSFKKFALQMRDFGTKRIRVNRAHKSIARFYHYGPLFLCLMLYSPLFFVPLLMALTNAFYITSKKRDLRFFIPITWLTLSFYRNYGIGELSAFFERDEK